MRCMKCGCNAPDGALYCPNCRNPLNVITDYDSLENLLADEVNDMLDNQHINDFGRKVYTSSDVHRWDEHKPVKETYDAENDYRSAELERERERERAAKARRRKEEQLRKKKQRQLITTLGICGVILVILVVLAISVFGKSYSSYMKKGEKAFGEEKYKKAIDYFEKAAEKKKTSAEPYIGIGNSYLKLDDLEKAEEAYFKGISVDEDSYKCYLALCEFYEEQGQLDKITDLFEECESEKVLRECSEYVPATPEISPEGGNYEDIVTVEITSDNGTIHYTLDNSVPTKESPVYEGPISIEEDGPAVVRAVCVNDKGIAGRSVKVEYTLNMPMVDGPSVSPAAGNYTDDIQITVSVPSGTKVYYTLDGSTPTTSSKEYTGPIDMPEGKSTFSCIAVTESGRESSVIRRQYNLITLE